MVVGGEPYRVGAGQEGAVVQAAIVGQRAEEVVAGRSDGTAVGGVFLLVRQVAQEDRHVLANPIHHTARQRASDGSCGGI